MHTRERLLAIIIIAAITPSIISQAVAQAYVTQQNTNDETYDISLFWSQSLGSKEWKTYKLWDDGISTHCYLSFKMNAGLSLSIPASLRLKYPSIVTPGQQFNLETYLNIGDDKKFTLSSDFYIKIDLDLPGVTTYVPNVGWIDDINNIYGASYEYTFNLNSHSVERLMKNIWLGGNDNILQGFPSTIELSDYVKFENLNINSQTLGNLMAGSIKIDVLKAILAIAKTVSNVVPPISLIINSLDWLITNVIKIGSGLIITPRLNGAIFSPISSDYQLSIDRQSLTFNQDISSKQTVCQVSSLSKESQNSNNLKLNFGSLDYKLSFDNNWEYYIDLDIGFLGLTLYQNTWTWDLGEFPNLSTSISANTPQINCYVKLDEQIQASTPQADNGEVSITASDPSSISNIALYYSTDRTNWAYANMISNGNHFVARPIDSVQQSTTVYYYFEASDGDNDLYKIDNNAQYYSYNLEPSSQNIQGIFSTGGSSIGLILIILGVIMAIMTAILLIKGRNKKDKVP